jgi:hypothetical protein
MNVQLLLGGLLIFLASNVGSYFYGMSVQEDISNGKVAKVEVKRAGNTIAAVVANTGAIVDGVKKDNELERKANERYETAMEELRKSRAANRELVRAAGGMRIPAPPCPGDHSTSGETEASSPSIVNDPFAGTIALPEQTQSDLQDLTEEADIILEKLRVLQQWIFDQGFYGPGEVDSSVIEPVPIH